jgi:polar amino acid transport system permease protein
MDLFTNPQYFSAFMGDMFEGLLVTLGIFGLTLVLSLPLGLLIALGRMSKAKIVNVICRFYIYVMRGTPLLLQIIFFYFGLLMLKIPIDRFPAVVFVFVLNYAAYFAEIYRGGIQSISHVQYEAAHVLGLSGRQTFMLVIFPQVIKNIFPPVVNEIITLVKDTSLAYAVSIIEILRTSETYSSRYVSFVPLIVAAIFYLILNSVLTFILNRIEIKKFTYYK